MKKMVMTIIFLVSLLSCLVMADRPMILADDAAVSRVWIVAPAGEGGDGGNPGLVISWPIDLSAQAEVLWSGISGSVANGDTVIFWPGTYDEQIDFSQDDCHFIGYGATVPRDADDDEEALTISGDNNIVEGFIITNASDNASNASAGLVVTGNWNRVISVRADSGTAGKGASSGCYVSGDLNMFKGCWFEGDVAGTGLDVGAGICTTTTAEYNTFINCYANSLNAATVYDQGDFNSFDGCIFDNQADQDAVLYSLLAGEFPTVKDCSLVVTSAGSANSSHNARIGLSAGAYGFIDNCKIYVSLTGDDDGDAIGIKYTGTTTPLIVRNTSIYTVADASYDAEDLNIADNATAILDMCSFRTDNVNTNTSGALEYAGVNVVQSEGADPIELSDIISTENALNVDSKGQVQVGNYLGRR